MLQIQPKIDDYDDWYRLAKRENLRYEILEFSSTYLNSPIPDPVLRKYRESGRVTSIHGAFMDAYPISPDLKIREISRQRCHHSCQLAQAVGARNVVFHSTALPFLRGPVMEGWCRDAAAYYQELARQYNLNIFLENFHDVTPEPLVHLMHYVKDSRVKVCLDVGHANYSRVPVKEWIEALRDSIGYLHLSDNAGEWDDHCAIGDGTIDLDSVSEWYERQGKDIPITVEVASIQGVERSLHYLAKRKYFGCQEFR